MRLTKKSAEVYLAAGPISMLGQDDMQILRQGAADSPRGRVRINAHPSEDDMLHEMFIAIRQDSYIRPHLHPGKSEAFHIVQGVVDIVVFNEDGSVREVVLLGDNRSGRAFYYRMSQPFFHTLLIRSEILIVHEITSPERHPLRTLRTGGKQRGRHRRLPATAGLTGGVLHRRFWALIPSVRAVVVGGTKGLGRVVVQRFLERGCSVTVISRSPPVDQELSARVAHVPCDLESLTDASEIARQIDALGGVINYLVFCQRYRGKGDPWQGELQVTLNATQQ
jgi:cupin fold WbuC family metalloprotein